MCRVHRDGTMWVAPAEPHDSMHWERWEYHGRHEENIGGSIFFRGGREVWKKEGSAKVGGARVGAVGKATREARYIPKDMLGHPCSCLWICSCQNTTWGYATKEHLICMT